MNITAKVLARDIKRYLLQGIKLEKIKEGAFEQGITEEKWNLALNILMKKARLKKRLIFSIRILEYFFVGVVTFYLYLWWEFSHKEVQMYYHYIDFIRQNSPVEAFEKVSKSEKIEVISREVKPFTDLKFLEQYVVAEDKKNIKSFEIFFDESGSVQKNQVAFEENGELKVVKIFKTGSFEGQHLHGFIEDDLLWIRVLQNIPTENILKVFGSSARTISLQLERDGNGNLVTKLMVVYEIKNRFYSTHVFFDKNGKRLEGEGKILSIFETSAREKRPVKAKKKVKR